MEVDARNVAIVGSVVYGALLFIGWIFFIIVRGDEPLYSIQNNIVSIFYVFVFSFLPTLFFLGATVPWLCAAYDSKTAAIVFVVVPGGLLVLMGLAWMFSGDVCCREDHDDVFNFLAYRPSSARYQDPQQQQQQQEQLHGMPPWASADADLMLSRLRQQSAAAAMMGSLGDGHGGGHGGGPEAWIGQQQQYGGYSPTGAMLTPGGTTAPASPLRGPTSGGGGMRYASLGDPSTGTSAAVAGFQRHRAGRNDGGFGYSPPQQQQQQLGTPPPRLDTTGHLLVPSPFPVYSGGGSSTCCRHRGGRLTASPSVTRSASRGGGGRAGGGACDNDDDEGDDGLVRAEPLFSARSRDDGGGYGGGRYPNAMGQ